MTRYAVGPAAFEIDSLPSQCQVAICHGFFVDPAARGKGHSHQAKRAQTEVLKGLAYDYAICTVVSSNQAQKRVLEKAGWECVAEFVSRRQDEHVEIWGFEVNQGGN
ncbi:GNAT family protein [Aquabacterium sp.]|uniref:GNAT family N-acetyltransferase n=1 Tax=Aquabacterium sp. TaxID=1872578 RepID=UPI002605C2DB|nr:GNAT family protein [Aquabacterium sp.]MDD2978272.1 GNAT family protein [Aquabacterium sp.]